MLSGNSTRFDALIGIVFLNFFIAFFFYHYHRFFSISILMFVLRLLGRRFFLLLNTAGSDRLTTHADNSYQEIICAEIKNQNLYGKIQKKIDLIDD